MQLYRLASPHVGYQGNTGAINYDRDEHRYQQPSIPPPRRDYHDDPPREDERRTDYSTSLLPLGK